MQGTLDKLLIAEIWHIEMDLSWNGIAQLFIYLFIDVLMYVFIDVFIYLTS